MKKRLLALLCVLAILAGMFVVPVSAETDYDDDSQGYLVGYAKRDINPWINLEIAEGVFIGLEDKDYAQRVDSKGNPVMDPKDPTQPINDIVETTIHDPKNLDGKPIPVKMVAVQLGGYGATNERRAACLTDDNGDGYISYGDGIYITCTTVTDAFGKTILYLTVDVSGVTGSVVKEMRAAIVKKLGADVISEDEIMVTANHSHAGASFSKGSAGSAYEAYYNYVLDRIADAAADAYTHRSEVNSMSKGSIEASSTLKKLNYTDSNGDGAKLNFVRHYITEGLLQYREVENGEDKLPAAWKDVNEDPVGGLITTPHSGLGFTQTLDSLDVRYGKGEYSGKRYKSHITYVSHVSDVDETLHVLRFDREEGDPILMINWRAHSTQNGEAQWHNISGDYANSLRYRLENNIDFGGDTNYCVAFWQGASGNVNPSGSLDGENIWKEDRDDTAEEVEVAPADTTDDFYRKYYDNTAYFEAGNEYNDSMFYCAKYGYLLAKVTLDCLDSEMVSCETGRIWSKQMVMEMVPQQYSRGLYEAALEWKQNKSSTVTGIFPYWYDKDLDGNGIAERYILNSKHHAINVLDRYPNQVKDLVSHERIPVDKQEGVNFEMNAIVMGKDVAIVTMPGEPYDRYSSEAILETINKFNDWDKLINADTYGTPFVLGYSNASTSYLANSVAYDYMATFSGAMENYADGYNEFKNIYGIGSYGSNSGDMAKGEGERAITELRNMLDTIHDGYKTAKCEACGVDVQWEPWSSDNIQNQTPGHGHYYLAETMTTAGRDYQKTIGDGTEEGQKTICLDLNGKRYTHNGRIFILNKYSTLNIMDSVGGGTIIAKSGSYNASGGMMTVYGNLNLYGGKLEFVKDEEYLTGSRVNRNTASGGVMTTYGGAVVNVYGGIIQGGELDYYYNLENATSTGVPIAGTDGKEIGNGGAINMLGSSQLNVYGGQILSGKAAENLTDLVLGYITDEKDENGKNIYEDRVAPNGKGDCVYVGGANAKVTIAGDAVVEDIYYASNNENKLTVSGNYTGQTGIQFNTDNVTLGNSLGIGSTVGTSAIKAGTITCANEGNYKLAAYGGDLMLFGGNVAAAIRTKNNGIQTYPTLQNAIDNYSDGDDYIKLLEDADGNVTVNKKAYLDLNGCSIGSVDGSGALYCLDTQTDDYQIEGIAGNYSGYGTIGNFADGTVKAVAADDGVAMDSYAMIRENKGYSFHCANLRLTDMSLRAKRDENGCNPSIYFKSDFAGDALVAENVDTFGVALNAIVEPDEDNMYTTSRFSTFTGFKAGENNDDATSTLLYGIMKESNARLTNTSNANRIVYGRAYIKLTGGGYVFGKCDSRSLKGQLEEANKDWSSYPASQKATMTEMYSVYKDIVKHWSVNNIKTEYESGENEVLKILIIGNSHSNDSMRLLNEVFKAQAPEQQVVLGVLYYSGCTMVRHGRYMEGNLPQYIYYKNGNYEGANPDGSWWHKGEVINGVVVDGATADDALADEQWDIIVMQQMNHHSATDAGYSKSEFMKVINHVQKKEDQGPKLVWNMVWTNPDNERYFQYNSGYALTGVTKNENGEIISTAAGDWEQTHIDKFPSVLDPTVYDQSVMYQGLVRCTQSYIVDDETFLGGSYFADVLPSGTAVEYLQDVLKMDQSNVYRDYTHLSDYSRLMVAYLLYAKFMQMYTGETVTIDYDQITEIPAVLHHEKSEYPKKTEGKYEVTQEMRDNIKAAVEWTLEHPFALSENE